MVYFKDILFFSYPKKTNGLFSHRTLFLNLISWRSPIYKTGKNGTDLFEAAFLQVASHLRAQFENHHFNQFNIFNDISCFPVSM